MEKYRYRRRKLVEVKQQEVKKGSYRYTLHFLSAAQHSIRGTQGGKEGEKERERGREGERVRIGPTP